MRAILIALALMFFIFMMALIMDDAVVTTKELVSMMYLESEPISY